MKNIFDIYIGTLISLINKCSLMNEVEEVRHKPGEFT